MPPAPAEEEELPPPQAGSNIAASRQQTASLQLGCLISIVIPLGVARVKERADASETSLGAMPRVLLPVRCPCPESIVASFLGESGVLRHNILDSGAPASFSMASRGRAGVPVLRLRHLISIIIPYDLVPKDLIKKAKPKHSALDAPPPLRRRLATAD